MYFRLTLLIPALVLILPTAGLRAELNPTQEQCRLLLRLSIEHGGNAIDLYRIFSGFKQYEELLSREEKALLKARIEALPLDEKAAILSQLKHWRRYDVKDYFDTMDPLGTHYSGAYFRTHLEVMAAKNASVSELKEFEELMKQQIDALPARNRSPEFDRILAPSPNAKYRTVSMTWRGVNVDQNHTVKLLTDNELKSYFVSIKDGLLRDSKGNPLTTAGYSRWFHNDPNGGDKVSLYVMFDDGTIVICPEQKINSFYHSSIAVGKNVAAAGEIRVLEGRVQVIADYSGHYQPPLPLTLQFIRELRERGATLTGAEIRFFDNLPRDF